MLLLNTDRKSYMRSTKVAFDLISGDLEMSNSRKAWKVL